MFSERLTLALVGAFLFVSAADFVSQNAQAGSPTVKPLKLEHMDYSRARKVILTDGWHPMGGPCMQVGENTCAHFPEIDVCTMVAPTYCAMVFIKQNQCLYIGTSGDPPNGSDEGAMRVETATFRPGPCSKN